jgi:hypothetical protein
MGRLDRIKYTHEDMIDFIIANPGIGLAGIAARYGYTIGWISNIMASDAWKARMAERRGELVDPVLTATITERMNGMVNLSMVRLMEKLEAPQCSDAVALKAFELGAKGLGIGGNAAPQPVQLGEDHLARLAQRLVALNPNASQGVSYHGKTIDVEVLPVSNPQGDGGNQAPLGLAG